MSQKKLSKSKSANKKAKTQVSSHSHNAKQCSVVFDKTLMDMVELLSSVSSNREQASPKRGRKSQPCSDTGKIPEQVMDFYSQWEQYLPKAKDLKQKNIGYRQSYKSKENMQLKNQFQQELKRCNIDDEIDLHGLSQVHARECLQNFLHNAHIKGLRKVRIIHGKGHHSASNKGVLQRLVYNLLQEAKDIGCVWEFSHPSERNGGRGATIVLLNYPHK